MGMVACFAGADVGTISRLKANPEDIEDFLYPDDGESEPEHYMDVDKAWHCIHFMLTGSAEGGAEPLVGAFFGGENAGEDMGYGPARLMQPEQVQRISAALSVIDEESFKARYHPSALAAANIYLADMCVRDGDDALDYLVSNYHELVEFYRATAERGDGAVLWIS